MKLSTEKCFEKEELWKKGVNLVNIHEIYS